MQGKQIKYCKCFILIVFILNLCTGMHSLDKIYCNYFGIWQQNYISCHENVAETTSFRVFIIIISSSSSQVKSPLFIWHFRLFQNCFTVICIISYSSTFNCNY